jgi:hypothetical protein
LGFFFAQNRWRVKSLSFFNASAYVSPIVSHLVHISGLSAIFILMANDHKPSDNKQAQTNKGIRKVNLNDLKGSLSSRGRERYRNDELAQAFRDAMNDGESFVWELAVVSGKTEKQVNASKAMWRSRATSVFAGLDGTDGHKVRIQWTADNEMVVTVYQGE